MTKIAIGTGSRYKVNAIKKSIYELDFEVEFTYKNVSSGVSEQPRQTGETKQGSISRSKNILEEFPDFDIGIGVEFGYEPTDDTYKMVCWGSIATKYNKVFSEQSSTLELPANLKNVLENNQDVSDNLPIVFNKLEDKERNRLFISFMKKRRVIYECVTNVMFRYLLDKDLY